MSAENNCLLFTVYLSSRGDTPTRYESVGCLWPLRAANVVCDDGRFISPKEL